ncbi:hypothetical protein V2J09_006006 [Rumex salicifolius]
MNKHMVRDLPNFVAQTDTVKPLVSHFKVWGCLAHAHVPAVKRVSRDVIFDESKSWEWGIECEKQSSETFEWGDNNNEGVSNLDVAAEHFDNIVKIESGETRETHGQNSEIHQVNSEPQGQRVNSETLEAHVQRENLEVQEENEEEELVPVQRRT